MSKETVAEVLEATGALRVINLHHNSKATQQPPDLENGGSGTEEEPLHKQRSKASTPHPRWAYIRSLAWARAVLVLAALYLLGLALVLLLFSRLPRLKDLEALQQQLGGANAPPEELQLALPRSFAELRAVRHTLELYRQNYGAQVASLMVLSYIFLQSFMIPGSICINILAGSMYPFAPAMAFVLTVSTCGASCNFLLARWLLREIVANLFPSRVAAFSAELRKHHTHLLNYLLFVRVTPIAPAWFVNLACPILGVPFHLFVIATAVGHLPVTFLTVQAGQALQGMESLSDLYSLKNVLFLLVCGCLALAPVALQRARARRAGGGGLPSSKPTTPAAGAAGLQGNHEL